MARIPPSLSAAQLRARRGRVSRIARRLGFVGRIEYRHAYSRSGGAQYQPAREVGDDRLVVFAEAFERDANPRDFSLQAIIAHERGHQLLLRHPSLAAWTRGRLSANGEEVLASLVGVLLCPPGEDREDLWAKAVDELLSRGAPDDEALRLIADLITCLEALL